MQCSTSSWSINYCQLGDSFGHTWPHAVSFLDFSIIPPFCNGQSQDTSLNKMFDIAILCLSVVLFFFSFLIILICCACIESSIQIKARLAGNLCKHFFSFSLISRPAKTWNRTFSVRAKRAVLYLGFCHKYPLCSWKAPAQESTRGNYSSQGQCSRSFFTQRINRNPERKKVSMIWGQIKELGFETK